MSLPCAKILRFHGIFLICLGGIAFANSLLGFQFSIGPFSFLSQNELAAVGFIEAYGLACILGFFLFLAGAKSYHFAWHLVAALIHLFLLAVNISFWHLYEPLGLQLPGILATGIHFLLVVLELGCFIKEKRSEL